MDATLISPNAAVILVAAIRCNTMQPQSPFSVSSKAVLLTVHVSSLVSIKSAVLISTFVHLIPSFSFSIISADIPRTRQVPKSTAVLPVPFSSTSRPISPILFQLSGIGAYTSLPRIVHMAIFVPT